MARKLKANGNGTEPKKRGKKADAPKPNLTDETIAEFYQKALHAKGEHEDALKVAKEKNGIYRAVLKDFKKVGGNTDDIIWRLAQRHRTPEEIDAETKRRNRIARLTNLPIGTQLGLLDDLTTVATSIENDAKPAGNDDDPTDAYQAGFNASIAGRAATENPYPDASELREQWDKGWGFVQSERAFGREPGRSATAH